MKAAAAAGLLCLHHAVLSYAAGSENGRLRGVGPEFAKFYKDASTFACISDPTVKVPFDRVNDDYCDCPDGSDEPGTSACSYLSPSSPQTPEAAGANLTLPGFYCKNKGHIPAYVPFTSVNDGICDYDVCCDGSEEWDSPGGKKCEDRCKEIGKEWRAQDEKRQKSLGAAVKRRREMVGEAGRLRKGVEERIGTLRTEIEGMERKVGDLGRELEEVEKRERGRKAAGGAGGGGRLGKLAALARDRIEDLKESLVEVKRERDDGRKRLEELEGILSTFKEEYNPNFNDEGVKRAVRAWEDYAARDKGNGGESDGDGGKEARERDLEAVLKSDEENGLKWEDFEGAEEEGGSETDVLYAFENYLPPTLRTWLDNMLRDLRTTLVTNGILAESSHGGSGDSKTESKAVTDARKARDSAQKDLDKSNKDLKSHTEDLDKDFGPDDVFRALKGSCVETDSGEYTYEVCFLEKTTQKPKKGGGHTNMGNFARLEKIFVDEDITPEGKGLGVGERWAMKYENGQHCWNGPNRKTTVVLGCSEKEEVWKVMEEEKCIYRMEVGTAAVCEEAKKKEGKAEGGKDEL